MANRQLISYEIDQIQSVYNSGEKMKLMGWSPKIKVQDRIKQVVQWSLKNPNWIEL